jgi:2-iminobutanoate/2-iminopropanoate deaminase
MSYGPDQAPEMPTVVGPYSQAYRVGELLFIAGQAGLDPGTGSVPDGGSEAEARQAFVNLGTVLRAAGASLDRVAKTTVFLSRFEDFATMNLVFAEFFPTAPPVRSAPIVALPRGLRLSIEVIAFVA